MISSIFRGRIWFTLKGTLGVLMLGVGVVQASNFLCNADNPMIKYIIGGVAIISAIFMLTDLIGTKRAQDRMRKATSESGQKYTSALVDITRLQSDMAAKNFEITEFREAMDRISGKADDYSRSNTKMQKEIDDLKDSLRSYDHAKALMESNEASYKLRIQRLEENGTRLMRNVRYLKKTEDLENIINGCLQETDDIGDAMYAASDKIKILQAI
jgi:chromosome segregation ATPase